MLTWLDFSVGPSYGREHLRASPMVGRSGGGWVAVVSPVNESVWEHLKMAYWPLTLPSERRSFSLERLRTCCRPLH